MADKGTETDWIGQGEFVRLTFEAQLNQPVCACTCLVRALCRGLLVALAGLSSTAHSTKASEV